MKKYFLFFVFVVTTIVATADVNLSGSQGGLHYATAGDGPYTATWDMTYLTASKVLTFQALSNTPMVRCTFSSGSGPLYAYMSYGSNSITMPSGLADSVTVTVVADIGAYIDGYYISGFNPWPYGAQQWTIGTFTIGGGSTPPPPVGAFRVLTFTLTNTSDYQRSAYVFVVESEGVGLAPTIVGAGETKTLTITVAADDTRHYYAAFADPTLSQNTYGGSELVTYQTPDGNNSSYVSGILPKAGTETATKTAADGTGTNTTSGGSYSGSGGTTQVSGRTGTGPATTTGTNDAATNAQLSTVGNSINQTVTNVGGAIQSSVNNAAGQINTALTGGSEQASAGFPATSTQTNSAQVGTVTTIVGKLPSAPSLPTGIGKEASWEIPLMDLGPYGGAQSVTLNLAPYSTAVTAVRASFLGVMGIAFFMAIVVLLRSATSG
jgi:hypothetical protein